MDNVSDLDANEELQISSYNSTSENALVCSRRLLTNLVVQRKVKSR